MQIEKLTLKKYVSRLRIQKSRQAMVPYCKFFKEIFYGFESSSENTQN